MCYALAHVATWAEEIAWVILSLHAQLRKDTDLSPAEAVFGAPIVCQINVYEEIKFLLTQFQSFLKNLWRCFLRFLCAHAQFELPAAERAPG